MSRVKQWNSAVEKAQKGISNLGEALSGTVEAAEDLKTLQDEYEDWRDNIPDGLDQGTVAEKLDEIVNLEDIQEKATEVETAIGELESLIGEYEAVDLPLGFGRD